MTDYVKSESFSQPRWMHTNRDALQRFFECCFCSYSEDDAETRVMPVPRTFCKGPRVTQLLG